MKAAQDPIATCFAQLPDYPTFTDAQLHAYSDCVGRQAANTVLHDPVWTRVILSTIIWTAVLQTLAMTACAWLQQRKQKVKAGST